MTRARENADGARLDAPLASPVLVTPNLGTPSAGVMTNVTGMPASALSASGISSSKFLKGDNTWDTAGSTSASDLDAGTLSTARMAAGSIVQVSDTTTASTRTGITGTSFMDSAVTASFTPIYDDSDVIINSYFTIYMGNTQTDIGYALRWKRVIDGGTPSYPASMTMGNESARYGTGYVNFWNVTFEHHYATTHSLLDSPDTDAEIIYTLQVAPYNADGTSESLYVGNGQNQGFWHMWFMEIKR